MDVVNHYNSLKKLKLIEKEKSDLVGYSVKTQWGTVFCKGNLRARLVLPVNPGKF